MIPSSLYQKFLQGNGSPEELETLFRYFNNSDEQAIRQLIEAELKVLESQPATKEEQQKLKTIKQLIDRQIAETINPDESNNKKPYRLWPRIAAAASVLLMLSAGSYFIWHSRHITSDVLTKNIKNDIAPGHNQATLTLANGQKIIITKGMKGQLARQGNTTIQANNTDIAYNSTSANHTTSAESVSYNTLTTARGEQSPYPLVLADGTKVWLNAQSSITFPTAFNQKERIVKLTGEAYFEVKHNEKKPFKVETEKQTIEDIGTAFNVNAYTDEQATQTTLVTGSVKVNKLILKPGEQTDGSAIKPVNTQQYTAWKDGDFNFDNDNITTVMRQLSRWYNIDVKYQGKLTNEGFHAIISRQRNISVVLRGLEKTKGVHFKIEGREVTVIQ